MLGRAIPFMLVALAALVACDEADTAPLFGGDAGPVDATAVVDASSADAGVPFDASVPDAGRLAAGLPCNVPSDCGPGYDCNTEAPGGYCLPGAPGGPMACRLPNDPCPTGTACSPLPFHAISGVCLRRCTTTLECRTGYVCNFVELFPGDPNTPRSAETVCWTVCQVGADQSCNDDPISAAFHGHCQADGTCACNPGSMLNPATGRCR